MTKLLQGATIALCCLFSCKSSDTSSVMNTPNPLSPEVIVTPDVPASVNPSCAQLPDCEEVGVKYHHRCIAYRYEGKLLSESQRLYSWGPSYCLAQKALADQVCDKKQDWKKYSEISCTPDPSLGHCPNASQPCPPSDNNPTRCYAKQLGDRTLDWDQRPTAWGASACEAKQKLFETACQKGFDPSELQAINCEADPHPGQCPPPIPDCLLDQKIPTECRISAIGEKPLAEPWKSIGMSVCEAEYRLKTLACLFTVESKDFNSDMLGKADCKKLL